MAEMKTKFRPEFLNRIDEIILFHRLKREQMAAIVDIQIGRLQKLLADRKLKLELDDAGAHLARQQGLRSGLRRPAAEARDPEVGAGPAGRADPGRARSRTARPCRLSVRDGNLVVNGQPVKAAA